MISEYALTMRRYAPNYHALCPHYQAPGNIEKADTQGIRPYALCVGTAAYSADAAVPRTCTECTGTVHYPYRALPQSGAADTGVGAPISARGVANMTRTHSPPVFWIIVPTYIHPLSVAEQIGPGEPSHSIHGTSQN